MTLLSLLIAMALERILVPSSKGQFATYITPYFNRLQRWSWSRNGFSHTLGLIMIAAVPAAATWLLFDWIDDLLFGLVTLLASVLLLFLLISCARQRRQYKAFLRAACRGDEQACYLIAQSLAVTPSRSATAEAEFEADEDAEGDSGLDLAAEHLALEQGVGQTLTWVNYRYYIAIMIWLVLFGVVGAIFYATLRTLVDVAKTAEQETQLRVAERLLNVLDFIPVRIASLGLTLVGNFSRAMPVWLESLLSLSDSPKAHLIKVSLVAEEIDAPDKLTCVSSVTKFVEMAKRNVILMLSLIAILTLYGSLA